MKTIPVRLTQRDWGMVMQALMERESCHRIEMLTARRFGLKHDRLSADRIKAIRQSIREQRKA